MTKQGPAVTKVCATVNQTLTWHFCTRTQIFYIINMVSQRNMTTQMYLLCNQIGLTSRTAGKDQLQLLFSVAAALGSAPPLASAASPAASQEDPPGPQRQLSYGVHPTGLLTHTMHCSMLLALHEQLLLLPVHVHGCCLLLVHEGNLVHVWRSHTCWGQMRRSHVLWLHKHWSSKGWLHGGCLWVTGGLMTHAKSHVAVHDCMEEARRGLAPNTRRVVRSRLAPGTRRGP